jgi:prepilin-type N-terminal cleavage/methylation domain-containing protein
MNSKTQPNQRGFTLIELLVVVAVGLVLMAIAVPMVQTTMDGIRLRGAMLSAANMAQQVRMQAIKQDLALGLFVRTVNNQPVLFIEASTATPAKPVQKPKPDPQYWLSTEFSTVGAPTGGVPPLNGLTMWGSNIKPLVNNDIFFNSRGLPCTPNPVVCNGTAGFVYYFKYRTRVGVRRWAAVSISPAGRIQSWFWNGSAWGN